MPLRTLWTRRWTRPPPSARRPARRFLEVERLESRELLAVNPFAAPGFNQSLVEILQQYPQNNGFGGIPQVTLAMMVHGQLYTGGATNTKFFKMNHHSREVRKLGESRPVQPDTVFRLASASKTFVAAAIVSLQQQLQQILHDANYSLLNQSAFALLGYSPGQEITGYNPTNPRQVVRANVPASLFNVTVADLLHMQSGLNGDAVLVSSQSFPTAVFGYPFYTQGSYAVMQFSGPPPRGGYVGPPTVPQTLNYFVFQVANNNGGANNPVIFNPAQIGTGFKYQNINFDIAGQIVANLAQQYGLADSYPAYLQQYVLGPLGIVPPSLTQPPTTNALFGPSATLQKGSYPTEVTYYTDPTNPNLGYSVFPLPRHVPPFYPPRQVFYQYGSTNIHVGAAGMVATPTALVIFQNYLNQVIEAGASAPASGPLTYASVAAMLSPAASMAGSLNYFGLGLGVRLNSSDPTNLALAEWTKGGNFDGTLSSMKRLSNGNTLAIIFNLEPPEHQFPALLAAVESLMFTYAEAATVTAVGSTSLSAPVGTAFPSPLSVLVTSAAGIPLAGIPVLFTIQASQGAGATFANGQTSILVPTDDFGIAVAPLTANDQTGAYTATAAIDNPAAEPVTFDLTNVATASAAVSNTYPLVDPLVAEVFEGDGMLVLGPVGTRNPKQKRGPFRL